VRTKLSTDSSSITASALRLETAASASVEDIKV
jgi:hypothetical protein